MERLQYTVTSQQSGMRIDLFLASVIPTLSRRKIRAILDVGGCYVNNKRMHIASRVVNSGDKVRVEYTLESLSKSKQKKFELNDNEILCDKNSVIAINKPAGLPSQATRDQDVMHAEVCLRNWLTNKGRKAEKLILLHRLDKETSGILLFATLPNTATWITEQFRERELGKTYWAICYGIPRQSTFSYECYLSEIDNKTGMVSVVRSGGKSSKTDFKVLAKNDAHQISLVECYPATGRSHQIRVHLESLGHPILGDKRYGAQNRTPLPEQIAAEAAKHHMLHARGIRFTAAPSLEPTVIEAEPPEDFQSIVKKLFN